MKVSESGFNIIQINDANNKLSIQNSDYDTDIPVISALGFLTGNSFLYDF